ncbi:hypothetical protein [Ruegeria lacuscaerulensis]|uniref:hypothetical protein n=1 Tax=Ruegeria lacuscaerulensis TaxID=55218 RepID=UPI001479E3C4|nr:hypothetical protein [Ruegeria lacuscaerulensis]
MTKHTNNRYTSGLARRDIQLPAWVENAMILRWFAIGLGVIFYWITESLWAPAIGIAVFAGIGHLVYQIYKKEDPVSAEIAFHNDTDGYHSGDADGDGDGGD